MLDVNINSLKLKNHDKSIFLLKDIHFSLESNNIYTIVGNNGSGKSTLLYAMANILDDNFLIDADFTLDGLSLTELNKGEKPILRLVFQDALSTFDPLKKLGYYFTLYALDDEGLEVELKYFQLPSSSTISKLYPHQLSVGMAQRLSIVISMLSEPDILLLDEPTSAIDLPIANLLMHRLKKFAKSGKIILQTTQDHDYAQHTSNFIAEMKSGILSEFSETFND